MDIIVFGTNHKLAPLHIRERAFISSTKIFNALPKIHLQNGVEEVVILSTCNRTEAYFVCREGLDFENISAAFLHTIGFDREEFDPSWFFSLHRLDAVRHCFRTACGLESQIIGENQILSQMKAAYRLSCEAGTSGPYLNRLFHQAFRAGKAVRTETDLAAGVVSIPSAAVDMVAHLFDKLSDKRALLIGAGEIGELVVKHLSDRGIGHLSIANRTVERAEALAQKFSGSVIPIDELHKKIFQNDIVVCAAPGEHGYILNLSAIPSSCDKSCRRTILIDLAVPRGIDPAIADLEQCFLYNIDNLKAVVENNISARSNIIPQAEQIIERFVREIEVWLEERKAVPVIKFLSDRFEAIRQAEIDKNTSCSSCEHKGKIDDLTKGIIKKILKMPIEKLLKNSSCSAEELKYVRHLFAENIDGIQKNKDRFASEPAGPCPGEYRQS